MKRLATVTMACLASIGTAHAAIGDTITCAPITGPLNCSASSAVVGNGAEFLLIDPSMQNLVSVDFSRDYLTVTALQNITNLNFAFRMFDLTNPFIGMYAYEIKGFNIFSGPVLYGDDHRIDFYFNNQSLVPGDYYRILLSDPMTGVPEPAAWAFLLGGMGAAGIALRRRRKSMGGHGSRLKRFESIERYIDTRRLTRLP